MSIVRRVRAVERLYARLDEEIKVFRQTSGIFCVGGCGKCCTKPDIEASPLEFLPLAFHWFLNGQAEEMLQRLSAESSSICTLYAPLSLAEMQKGSCGSYIHRGLVCRLFGYSANRDKLGQLRMVTCKVIKEGQPENMQRANELLAQKDAVPVFTDYYKRLIQIDFKLANQFLPINEAIREALETVLHYYAYRPFPKLKKAA